MNVSYFPFYLELYSWQKKQTYSLRPVGFIALDSLNEGSALKKKILGKWNISKIPHFF